MMNNRLRLPATINYPSRQNGVVLFFALIALVVMSLAAVALIRSVDTSTMIAGNLAFRQAAVTSADAGAEAAIAWLNATQAAATTSVVNDPAHVFNTDNPQAGYYTSFRPVAQLTNNSFNWNNSKSIGTDASGNTIRYIIERMCVTPNVPPKSDNCLMTPPIASPSQQEVRLADNVCKYDAIKSPGCPLAGEIPQLRLTAQVTGPKNTVSYIQTFVY